MEWHHSGFYKGATGKTMGRTYFISLDETQDIIDNFDTLYPVLEEQKKSAEEDVCAFYWTWENQGSSRRPRWCKALKTYEGKRAYQPRTLQYVKEMFMKWLRKQKVVSTPDGASQTFQSS